VGAGDAEHLLQDGLASARRYCECCLLVFFCIIPYDHDASSMPLAELFILPACIVVLVSA
jgi:hypothetical protein